MKENITANQENFLKVLAFLTYILEILKHLKFLFSKHILEKLKVSKKSGRFQFTF